MNNKTQKLLSLAFGFILLGGLLPLKAQINQVRLQRDLEVAEAVVNEMFETSKRNECSALYLQDYGVIIRIPKANSSFAFNIMPNFNIKKIVLPNVERIFEGELDLLDKQMELLEKQMEEMESNPKNRERLERRRVEIESKREKLERTREKVAQKKKQKSSERENLEKEIELRVTKELEREGLEPEQQGYRYIINGKNMVLNSADSTERAKELEEVKAKMQKFIRNYADLIGQLKPSDKIILVYEYASPGNNPFVMNGEEGATIIEWHNNIEKAQKQLLTMSIDKQSLNDFKAGKITSENLPQQLKVQNIESKPEEGSDLDIMASILEKLLKKEYKEQNALFAGANKVSYTYLPDFGVIYHLKVQPLNRVNFVGIRTSPNIRQENGRVYIYENTEETEVRENAPKTPENKEDCQGLINQLKEYLLQYGRTLRSLNEKDQIIVELDLGQNFSLANSECPEKVYLSISKKQITAYEKSEQSFEQTLQKIKQVNR